jgi:hypothetical protein
MIRMARYKPFPESLQVLRSRNGPKPSTPLPCSCLLPSGQSGLPTRHESPRGRAPSCCRTEPRPRWGQDHTAFSLRTGRALHHRWAFASRLAEQPHPHCGYARSRPCGRNSVGCLERGLSSPPRAHQGLPAVAGGGSSTERGHRSEASAAGAAGRPSHPQRRARHGDDADNVAARPAISNRGHASGRPVVESGASATASSYCCLRPIARPVPLFHAGPPQHGLVFAP